MINQKNDLNMITRKLEAELLSFHYDGLEISEITTKTSWMKLHVSVLFIKDDVQITKEMYKDYETGLWYYIISDGMIRSHKDTYNHTIKKLIDDMIYDCHLEMEEVAKETSETSETKETEEIEDLDEYEEIIENVDLDEIIENENLDETTIETIPHVDVDCSNLKKLPKKLFGGFPTITEMYNNKCFCCPADRQGNRCGGEQWCKETWKRYEAIINPECHHVSLATLANLDFDMLDTKRQKYMTIYKLARNTIKSMYKCKSITQYRSLTNRLITYVHSAYRHDRCTIALVQYVRAKIADVNVNCNIQSSVESEEFGYHESRRYN